MSYPYLIFSWILFTLTTPFVFIRLYVQLRFRKHPRREIFVILAWVIYLADTSLDTIRTFAVPTGSLLWWELNYTHDLIYKVSMYSCKAAMLCFYIELTPRNCYSKTWWGIVAAWVFVIAGALFQILSNLLDCFPFIGNFGQVIPSKHKTHHLCFWTASLVMTSWTFYLLTDLLVYTIPFFILYNIKSLSPTQKRGATVLFAAGLFNIACSGYIVYISSLQWVISKELVHKDYSHLTVVEIYNYVKVVHQGSAIMIVCMPQVRRLWMGVRAGDLRPELRELQAEEGSRLELCAVTTRSSELGVPDVDHDRDSGICMTRPEDERMEPPVNGRKRPRGF